MKYEIRFAYSAVNDLKRLDAHDRSLIKAQIETHLRHEPEKLSRSRIKRLRELNHPEYRLRIDKYRVFYDVIESTVYILGIVKKSGAADWLQGHGEKQ